MPVLIPSGLYSAGKFTVDLSPIERVIKQRNAEKKAAQEAATKYFSGLKEKINTAGVRSVDLQGGLQDKINQWVNSGVTNLDKISKGGQPYNDFMASYKGILNDIEKSKNRSKFETDLGKAQFEGKYDPDVDDVHVLSKVSKSIYDPESYKEDGVSEYTYGDIPSAVPPFDPNKQNQFFTAVIGRSKPTYNEEKARTDDVTGKVFIPKEFNDQSIKEIADNAVNVFYGDKSAQRHYKNQLGNADWVKKANDAYQSIYGTEQIVDTPEKAAQADAIMRTKLAGEEIEVTDPNYAQKLKREMEDIRNKNRAKLQAARQAAINARAAMRKSQPKAPDITYGEYYNTKQTSIQNSDGSTVTGVKVEDIYDPDNEIINGKGNILPYKDKNGKEYYKVRGDGNWEGKNGVIDKQRVLDMPIRDLKGKTSKVENIAEPSGDIAISQYPENIQKGIVAFSQKNNLSLSDALDILKQNRPEIFS